MADASTIPSVKKHPEQAADEIFVGNHKVADWPNPLFRSLTTARLGAVAYAIDGAKLTEDEGMRPLFVGSHEGARYDAIQMAEFSRICRGGR